MFPLFSITVFIFGTLIGSFLNVVVLRYGTGRGIVKERSSCFSCGKVLHWYELVPIISFIFQKGRCHGCQSKISWQYPAVEFITGLIFVLVFWKLYQGIGELYQGIALIFLARKFLDIGYNWTIFSILIVISVYDLRHKIIPNGLVYAFIVFSFLGSIFILEQHQGIALISRQFLDVGASGLLIALPFFLLWLFSGGRAMGFGDVKLSLGIGFFLGLQKAIYAVVWSFWIGGFVSIILLILSSISQKFVNSSKLSLCSKRFTIKSEIPFGPFLVLGLVVAYFTEWDFLNLELIWSLF